jgi:hypothetical protein
MELLYQYQMFQTQTTIHEVESIKCVHKQLLCSRNKWVHKQLVQIQIVKSSGFRKQVWGVSDTKEA